MRSFVIFGGLVAVCAWVAISRLPATEARAAQPPLVRTQEVQSVAIDGGRGLPLAALRARLTTRPGQLLDATQLDQDRVALEAELASRGRLAARVEPAVVSFAPNGAAYVTFPVTQGPMFKLRRITVTGATERDAGVVTLSEGDEAIAGRIERARQAIADHLGRLGKPTIVTIDMQRDLAAAAVDVVFSTRTSPQRR